MNMQETILAPNLTAIRQHIAAWAAPFAHSEFEDGLCEIAYTAPNDPAPNRARLFGLGEIDAAANFAAARNAEGANIYIGAALRAPDADRKHRSTTLDFYAAAYAACEADEDAEAVAQRIEAAGLKGAIRVKTGGNPELRVHHWLHLREFCADPDEYTAALGALVAHVGADARVKDSARILRLGGTVNWISDPAKRAKGYVDELTLVKIEDAPTADLDRLSSLAPMPGWQPKVARGGTGGNGGPGEIIRNADGFVTDGREAFWRNIVMAELATYQRATGADPTGDELFDAAFPRFSQETLGDDRWTSDQGQTALRKRAQNTLRRLRVGHLAGHGLYSIETETGRAEAEQVQAERDRRRAEIEAKAAPTSDADPVDLWGSFDPPELPRDLLPPIIEEFARANGDQMGADPAGLAVAALVTCAAAIPDEIKIKVKRHDDWTESARLWAALMGPPSAKKSPIISAATGPLCRLDVEMMRAWQERVAQYEALPADERKGKPRPQQTRLRIEDATVEAAQQVLEGSPWGVLLLQDELSGFFGAMDKYNGGKAAQADRAFWLRSFNGGAFALNRVGRGAAIIDNLSISMLGGIQPEPLRKIAGDAVDDGLLQRLFPIMLRNATMGRDEPMPDVNARYRQLVEALRGLSAPGFAGTGVLEFDNAAQAIRRDLEARHLDLQSVETINRKLASHIGKYDGLFARLCVVWHCIEHAGRELPTTVTEPTAQRVAAFLHRFLLAHAIAFYSGVLGLSDDHDQLTAIAGYILAHKVERITNRDVQRSIRTMRNLREQEIRPLLEQLAALGWLNRIDPPRPSSPPHWQVNPAVHAKFIDRAAREADRRLKARETIQNLSGANA
nr:DUF3987 domain-containing protein [uncultured Roseovarius sp.]